MRLRKISRNKSAVRLWRLLRSMKRQRKKYALAVVFCTIIMALISLQFYLT